MTFEEFNQLEKEEVQRELSKCCGSSTWVEVVASLHPYNDKDVLFALASQLWLKCSRNDWLEAFTHHPKIGDLESLKKRFGPTKEWSEGEQVSVEAASQETLLELAEYNQRYEDKFEFIFIVCATGKSADEMLEMLKKRINNNPEKEIKIAAQEQREIMILRLEKLLS
ncbi:MAG: OHCU decarboxylase [Flavobacteriales bacterium]|nr:MAG: OHCU decarboxylase [Flavobacteriales bacterium]